MRSKAYYWRGRWPPHWQGWLANIIITIALTIPTTPTITLGTTTRWWITAVGPMRPIAIVIGTSESFAPRNRRNIGPGATIMAIVTETTIVIGTAIITRENPSSLLGAKAWRRLRRGYRAAPFVCC